MKHRFYKEQGAWYIDIPNFVEDGYGTQGDLMLVCGADKMLDVLSGNGEEVSLLLDKQFREGYSKLLFLGYGMDKAELVRYEHPEVDYGAYYLDEDNDIELWLCPTTLYIFGEYPEVIYYKKA